MKAIETVVPATGEPDASKAAEILEACKAHGLLVGKGGLYGNVVRITPMLDVTESEIDEGAGALVDAIRTVDAAAQPAMAG